MEKILYHANKIRKIRHQQVFDREKKDNKNIIKNDAAPCFKKL